MTYPQQPPYPPQGQPGYPPQGQPGYAPQPGYQPQQQGYAPLPQAPAPGYPPQTYYQQPPAAYAPQYAPQPPAGPAPARGTLEDFMDQPSGGGGTAISKYFNGPPPRPQGSWLQLQVQRDHTAADVEHQKSSDGVLQYFKHNNQPDLNRPKFVLILKTFVVGASDPAGSAGVFTDGSASVWIKGVTRDALVAAIGAAGLPNPDKILASGKIGGAVITMVSAGEKPSGRAGFNPTKLFNFTYTPGGHEMDALREDVQLQETAQAASGFPAPVPPTVLPAAPPQPPATPPGPAQYAPPQMDPSPYAQQAPQGYAPAGYAPPTAPPAPPAAPTAPPAGYQQYAPPAPPVPGQPLAPPQVPLAPAGPPMTAEMQATLARLSGQPQ